jgi:glycosyltransferase involved in cell wall biosynthesis
MPRVSIVIPVRDQSAYLGESLASVFHQTHGDVEVIVVDDGSQEDLARVLAPYGGRLRYDRLPPSGVAAATNHGASLARGELLAFHDADDLMEPDRVTALLAALDADPEIALAFGNGLEIDAHGRSLGPVIPPRQARSLVRHGLRMRDLLRRSLVYVQAMLVRRSVFLKLGGLPPLATGGDWGFALRCVLHHRTAYVDRPLFRYRQHGASLTAGRVAMAAGAVAVLRDLIAREPALAAHVGQRQLDRALARRLARLAAQELAAGEIAAGRSHLEEAAALAPRVVKYRLRLLRLRLLHVGLRPAL